MCPPLWAVAPHLFTTRHLSTGADSSRPDPAYDSVARALGVSRVAYARQVHGASVYVPEGGGPLGPPEADILLTTDPEQAVLVRVADCVPLLMADWKTGAVAAVHAGWRGTRAGASVAAIDALRARYGTAPTDVVVAIGPSIGPCCYQVGEDVRAAFVAAGVGGADRWFQPDGDWWRLDMWAANRDQLVGAGVPPAQIHIAEECTATSLDRYYSFRREGAAAGRLLAVIRPAGRHGPHC